MLLSVTKTNNSNPTIGELKCKSQNARSSKALFRQPLQAESSLRLLQNLRPIFPQNGIVKLTSSFLVTAVQALLQPSQLKMQVQRLSSLKKQLRAAATQPYLRKTFDFANSQKDQELLEAFVDEAMKSKDFLLSLAPDQKVYIYGHAGFQNIPESDAIDKWRFRTPKGQKTRGGDMLFNNYRYAVETVRKVTRSLRTTKFSVFGLKSMVRSRLSRLVAV